MRDKDYKKRLEVVPARLAQVLDEVFFGNVRLMAFCCDTDTLSLKAWLGGKRLPQDTGYLPYIIGVNPAWLNGRSDSRDPIIISRVPISYESCTDLANREKWLKRELIRVNALYEAKRKKTAGAKNEESDGRFDDLREKLRDAAKRLGYDESCVNRAASIVERYEVHSGRRIAEMPRELWPAIRGVGKKYIALLYEAFPENKV